MAKWIFSGPDPPGLRACRYANTAALLMNISTSSATYCATAAKVRRETSVIPKGRFLMEHISSGKNNVNANIRSHFLFVKYNLAHAPKACSPSTATGTQPRLATPHAGCCRGCHGEVRSRGHHGGARSP